MIRYDDTEENFVIESDECDCGQPLYQSSCDAPGCNGLGCQGCGTGCDLDFVPDGRCASAIEAEDDEDRDGRITRERAAWGLS
jgi:hypothetical protein